LEQQIDRVKTPSKRGQRMASSNLTDEQIEALVRDLIEHAPLSQNDREAALAWLDKVVTTRKAVRHILEGKSE
jgi:hypothetical protein